jgi:hypothetical protein
VEAHKFQEVTNSQENLIIIEEIFWGIGKQILETNYSLNLGKLLKIAIELKRYLWQKLKLEKTQNLTKVTIENKLVLQYQK